MVCPSEHLCVAYTDTHRHQTQVSFMHDPLNSMSRWHRYTLRLPRSIQYVGQVGCVPSGGCIMLGTSLAEDHDRRIIIPATIVSALLGGSLLGWGLNYFFHFAQMTGPGP